MAGTLPPQYYCSNQDIGGVHGEAERCIVGTSATVRLSKTFWDEGIVLHIHVHTLPRDRDVFDVTQ